MEFQVITPQDLLGPLNAFEQKFAPDKLFLAGDASIFKRGPRVSVVGSRKASDDGLTRTRQLCALLIGQGIHIVSGLAEGVDRVAHQTSIQSGGRTIGVLGTPLERCYPSVHRDLQLQMMREQVVISQFPEGMRTQPWHFPQRNRLMALLSDATVIVEAGDSSGTLSQGWEALRLGRPLYLMESVVVNRSLKWPEEMLRYGAQVLSRANLEDLFEHLPTRAHEEPSDALIF